MPATILTLCVIGGIACTMRLYFPLVASAVIVVSSLSGYRAYADTSDACHYFSKNRRSWREFFESKAVRESRAEYAASWGEGAAPLDVYIRSATEDATSGLRAIYGFDGVLDSMNHNLFTDDDFAALKTFESGVFSISRNRGLSVLLANGVDFTALGVYESTGSEGDVWYQGVLAQKDRENFESLRSTISAAARADHKRFTSATLDKAARAAWSMGEERKLAFLQSLLAQTEPALSRICADQQ